MTGKWEGGKGDRQRVTDIDKYRGNYAKAFGYCAVHPTYKALRPPTADCVVCRRLWRERKLDNDGPTAN
jgi:hypothetical protein